jgi:hypothetical protein
VDQERRLKKLQERGGDDNNSQKSKMNGSSPGHRNEDGSPFGSKKKQGGLTKRNTKEFNNTANNVMIKMK